MPVTGYTSSTPNDVLVDAGVLYYDVSGTPTLLGATRGGFTFDPAREMREMEFDGLRSPVKGNHRVVRYESVLSGKLLEIPATKIAIIEPGSTQVAGPPIVVTPQESGPFLASGDYLTNLWWYIEQGDGAGYKRLAFAAALCRKYTLVTADKTEGEYDVEFLACVTTADLGAAPYVWSYEAALPE